MVPSVTRKLAHHLVIVLGMLAMLGTVLVVPASALATLANVAPAASGAVDDAPCHEPCRHCPKACFDMMGCLLKCFSPAVPLPAAAVLGRMVPDAHLRAATASALCDIPVPPLLRPPIA